MKNGHYGTISILLAVYHPRLDWLEEQLLSLEAQTYPNLELDIVDDGPDRPVGEAFFKERLRRIPFRYHVHEENRGSNRTFEELVRGARGEYIAFCDQDDRWTANKLEKLHVALCESDAQLSYSNLSVIDENGMFLADDIREIRTRDVFLEGDNIANQLLLKSCIYGSSLLVRRKTAQEALPLPQKMGFDHWFALWAAIRGKIVFLDEYLVEHRIHGENQSKPLRGVKTKSDYMEQRILALQTRNAECMTRLQAVCPFESRVNAVLSQAKEVQCWAIARERWHKRDLRAVVPFCMGRPLSPKAFWFELFMPFMPEFLFRQVLKLVA